MAKSSTSTVKKEHRGSRPASKPVKRSQRPDDDGHLGSRPLVRPPSELADDRDEDAVAEHASMSSDAQQRRAAESLLAADDQGELEFSISTTAMERALPPGGFDESAALEAWYASYASRASQLITRTERRRGIIPEALIGRDDRVRITDSEDYPWRTICSLRITAGDGSPWVGTGWFIAPRVVITAGHCVYIHNRGKWVRSIEVIPGRDGGTMPYGMQRATRFRSVGGWVQRKKPEFDYGAILLGSSQEFAPYPGNLLFDDLSDSDLTGLRINVAGYPGDKPTGTMWWHHDRIANVGASTLSYLTDTAGGQSGAPAFVKRGEERIAVGIHNYGGSTSNSATRITAGVLANFELWMSQA